MSASAPNCRLSVRLACVLLACTISLDDGIVLYSNRSSGPRGKEDGPVVILRLNQRLPPEHVMEEMVKEHAKGIEGESEEAAGGKEEVKSESAEAEGGEHTGWAVACFTFFTVFFVSTTFAMTQTTIPHVANNTVLVLDNIIAIFLAVLWFQGFDNLMDVLPHPHHRVLTSCLHAVTLILIAFAMAWATRNKKVTIAIFCGCGAHYCAFAASHASLGAQAHFFKDHPLVCCLGTFAVLGVLIAGGAVLYRIKKAMGMDPGVESSDEGQNTFVDRFDDVESDFAAMALAVYWVMVVQFSLMQEWPDADIEPGAKPEHTPFDRFVMFAYTALLFVAGPFIISKLSGLGDLGYLKSRLIGLATSFIAMSCAFSFLTWGKMSFFEHEDMSLSPIFARIIFAAVCSATAMAGIFIIAGRMPAGAGSRACITALGLIAGYSWEEVFDAAVEDVVEGTPWEHFAKAGIAIAGALIVLPTYAAFVKPKSMEAAEQEGA